MTMENDEEIQNLKHKINLLNSQLTSTNQYQEEDKKKLERQHSVKIRELESSRKALEEKIMQKMSQIDSDQKKFYEAQKEWGAR